MRRESDANPGRYVLPPDGWEGLAARMVDGLIAGRANLSDAARKTARQLGGKPTYAGVKELLTAPEVDREQFGAQGMEAECGIV